MKSVAWKGDHPITSYYGWRTDPITGARSFHDGVDVSMPIGTELYATVNGKVRLATTDSYGGKYIQIQTSDGRGHWCLHLSEFKVKAGDMVQKGNLIGLSGNSGHSTGPHTHFGLQSNAEVWNSAIDPLPYLQGTPTSTFKKGDRIVFTDIQHVRAGSGTKYDIQTKTVAGQKGTIKDNPRVADGYTWYDVQFDGGGSGWCADVKKFRLYDPAKDDTKPTPIPEPTPEPPTPPVSEDKPKEVCLPQEEVIKLTEGLTACTEEAKVLKAEISKLKKVEKLANEEKGELQIELDNMRESKERIEQEKLMVQEELDRLKQSSDWVKRIAELLSNLFNRK